MVSLLLLLLQVHLLISRRSSAVMAGAGLAVLRMLDYPATKVLDNSAIGLHLIAKLRRKGWTGGNVAEFLFSKVCSTQSLTLSIREAKLFGEGVSIDGGKRASVASNHEGQRQDQVWPCL